MNVLIADKLPEYCIDDLKKFGLIVTSNPGLTADDLKNVLHEYSILVVRSTKVNADAIKSGKKLSLIIRAGAGVNNIDLKTASSYGIYVANCPGKNSIAVAELAMGHIIALDRKIPDNVMDFRNGTWNKALYSKATGLYGRKIGVIGMGQIGSELLERARSFGMELYAWSRSLTPEKAEDMEINYCKSVDELIDTCDIISIHVALTDDTRGMIDATRISKMKPGAFFINTSRAEVVDEDALIDALKEGKISAGLDVFSDEPEFKQGEFKSRFDGVPNVYITHHTGASTVQAQNAVADAVVEIVDKYINEGHVMNWVNRCESTDAKWQLVVRHFDKPGVIANVMTDLKAANINAEEFQNVIFAGKIAACCTIQLSSEPSEEILSSIRGRTDEVISVDLIQLN